MIPFNRRQTTAQSQRNSINFSDYLDDKQLFVPGGGDYDANDPYYQLPVNKFDPSAVAGAKYGLGYAPEPSPTIAPQTSIPQAPISRKAPTPKPPDIDYPSAYAKIIDKQNRPNRLEYERMVKEGAPQIPQSRWARLGAALAGGGVTWATGDSARGYQLGMSALEGPQKRSDEAYDRKLKGFGELAQSEERDISEQIKALEFQQRNYLDQRADARADNADRRADIMTDAQLEDLAIGRLKAVERTNGHTYLYDPKSKEYVADLGPTKFTPEQLTAHAVAEYKAKKDVDKPFDIDKENRDFEHNKSLIEIKDENAREMLKEKQKGQAELLVTRMRTQLDKMGPAGERYKDQYLKIIAAIENDPELAGTDYIIQDPNTGIIDVKPISMFDFPTTKAKKEKLHAMVAAGLDAAASPAAPAAPNVTTPTSTSSAVSPNTPKNYDGTIPIIGADGKTDNIPAADLQLVLDNGGRVNPAGVINAPAVNGPELPRTGVTPTTTAAKFGAMPPPMFGAGVNPSMPAPVAPPRNINNFLPAPPPTATPAGNIPPPNAPVAAPPISAAPTVAPPNRPGLINPTAQGINPITLQQLQNNPRYNGVAPASVAPNTPPPNAPPPGLVNPEFQRNNPITLDQLNSNPKYNPQGQQLPPNPIQLGPAPVNVPPPNVPPAPPPQIPMGVAPRQAPTNPLLRAQLQGLATPPVTPPQQAPSSPLLNSPILPPQPSPGRVADSAPANPITLSNNRGAGIYKNDLVNEDMGEPPVSTAPPSGAKVFDQKFETVRAKLREATGIDIKAISKVRTEEQQKKLYAQGRGKGDKRPIITELDGTTKKSKHQTGEAADIAFVDKRGKTIKPNDKLWNTFGRLAREEGLIWGGDWKSLVDKGHIQLGEVGQQ